MPFIKRLSLLCLMVFLALPAQAEVLSRIAAVVNDRIITTHQLDASLEAALTAEGGRSLSDMERANLRSELLSRLIEESLVEQKIEELGIRVDDAEVESAIRDVLNQNRITREQMVQALRVQGMEFDVYKEKMRKQILHFKLVSREVQSKVEVTSQEVREYFRDHIDDYREAPYMRISRVTFHVPKGADAAVRETLREKAEKARERLTAGEDLETLLKGYAVDGSAEGGDMGTFKEGELIPAFDRAIRDLQESEVSEVVEAPDGDYYLFKVMVRQPGTIRHFDTVKNDIERTLLEENREKRFQEWAQGLRKEAYIDIRI